MIDTEANQQIWDYAYAIGSIKGVLTGYNRNTVRSQDALARIEEILEKVIIKDNKDT